MKKFIFLALLFSCGILSAGKIWFEVKTDKNPLSYKVGEKITFTLRLLEDGKPLAGKRIAWELWSEDGSLAAGEKSSSGPVIIRTRLKKPGFVNIEAKALEPNGREIKGALVLSASAGADVHKIAQTAAEPADFDSFWQEQKKRLAQVPLEYKLTPQKSKLPNVKCWSFEIKCAGKYPATGYLYMPVNAEKKSRKAFVKFYGYSFSPTPREDVLGTGSIGVSVNRFGLPEGKEKDFYRKMQSTELKNFGFRNNRTPEESDFLFMALRGARVLEFVRQLPEFNGKDLTVYGGSMGGYQALSAAMLDGNVSQVSLYVPWCADLAGVTAGRFHGWRPEYCRELDYFDPVNLSKRITTFISLTTGLGDRTCPPSGHLAMFNAIKCKCLLKAQQTDGHRVPSPGFESFTLKK